MPYPNEHSCRLRSPNDFQPNSFRRIQRGKPGQKTPNGRPLSIIIGRLRGKTTTEAQAYRYPKDDWTAAAARAHCKRNKGMFEAAKPKSK